MRLLHSEDDNTFRLVDILTEVPPYAILSHTWGADEEEVTLKDVMKKKNLHKLGYAKLKFCAKQAATDGLKYFWVDTCCIDKSSSAELSEAINSMYTWYRDAAICYALLSDVPTVDLANYSAFENSRWFTRGWTLQEMLAPRFLSFFSAEGDFIGDKRSRMQSLRMATNIPMSALNGQDISTFSIEERLSWAEKRQTKRQEDTAYSLLGLFDVQMPLIYGEGKSKAFQRLRKEIALSQKVKPQKDQLFVFVRDFLVSKVSENLSKCEELS
jgi:hypothetical protein